MSAWQSTQLSLAWTDFAKTSGRTPIHSGARPFLRGLNSASWQSMHSLFGTTAGLAVAGVASAARAATEPSAPNASSASTLGRRQARRTFIIQGGVCTNGTAAEAWTFYAGRLRTEFSE